MEIVPIPGFSEPLSSLTHLFASAVALLGGVLLYKKAKGSSGRVFSVFVFTFSLIFLFSMSGVYHLLEPGGTPRHVMMHLDHSAIWVLIAGTFTPIHIILFRGVWRWGILGLVWTLAITGLVLKIVFFTNIPEWLGLTFYLGLGWIGIISGFKIRSQYNQEGFLWLWVGGVAYSFGAVLEFLRWPIIIEGVFGPHEIFHVFVVLGALSHWLFVYKWADHPIKNVMTFKVQIFPEDFYIARAVGDFVRIEARSLEELHLSIKNRVTEKYHKSIQPEIHLKYSQEEILRHKDLSDL